MKKNNSNLIGLLYFLVHFILETTTFYIISSYTTSKSFWYIAILFDLFAFVPQALIGAISDKYRNINFGLIGVILTTVATTLLKLNANYILIVTFLTIGNCFIHVHGAESTLRTSNGKMFPSALFVSGGAFGIITGKLLNKYNITPLIIILANIISFLIISYTKKYQKEEDNYLDKYNYANPNINIKVSLLLAVFVVAIRSYMGYAIPTSWNDTIYKTILLYCFMGIGKATGGILIDKINIKTAAIVSTVVALPFIIFGNNNMIISLIGIMFFSMTMPVTLAITVSWLKTNPGIAFGLTTTGLFLGSMPLFFYKVDSLVLNYILLTSLTILSIIILYKITDKRR